MHICALQCMYVCISFFVFVGNGSVVNGPPKMLFVDTNSQDSDPSIADEYSRLAPRKTPRTSNDNNNGPTLPPFPTTQVAAMSQPMQPTAAVVTTAATNEPPMSIWMTRIKFNTIRAKDVFAVIYKTLIEFSRKENM